MSLILLEFYTLLFGLEYLCFWLSVAVCDNHQPYFCLQSLPQGNWKLQLCGRDYLLSHARFVFYCYTAKQTFVQLIKPFFRDRQKYCILVG